MKNKNVLFITQAGIIAALYVVLTALSSAVGLSSGAIQVRLSEALTILPIFTPAAIPGLFIGCLISNTFVSGSILVDIIFGSLATLAAAYGTYALRKYKFAAPIPPILANTIVVPFILRYGYGLPDAIFFMAVTVFIGEFISAGVFGTFLTKVLLKYRQIIFPYQEN